MKKLYTRYMQAGAELCCMVGIFASLRPLEVATY